MTATTRKPAPAKTSRPIPPLERALAALALGSAALAGCENPFYAEDPAADRGAAAALVAPAAPPAAPVPAVASVPHPGKFPSAIHHVRTAGRPLMVRPPRYVPPPSSHHLPRRP